jgi:hypothetical protein
VHPALCSNARYFDHPWLASDDRNSALSALGKALCRAHGQCDREAGAAEIAGRTAVYCQSIASIVIASC